MCVRRFQYDFAFLLRLQLREDKVPSVEPSQLHDRLTRQSRTAVADAQEDLKHVKHIAEPCEYCDTVQRCYAALIEASQHVVNVLDDVADETDLKHQRWQVVVEEERTLEEEVWHEVDQVAEEQCESNILEFPPFLVT